MREDVLKTEYWVREETTGDVGRVEGGVEVSPLRTINKE